MRKLGLFVFGVFLSFSLILMNGISVFTASADAPMVYIGGMSAGFSLQSGNPQVVGLCEIITEKGTCSPALEGGIRVNDRIITINGVDVENIEELNEIIDKNKQKPVKAVVERGSEKLELSVSPVKDKISGKYKIGVLVRDNVSGIGTVTFINPKTGRFGALGHSVTGENKRELKISKGEVYSCSILSVNKGVRGKAGELKGMFINDQLIGDADKLCSCGIFGTINNSYNYSGLTCAVADSSEAVPGDAYIYSTTNGIEKQRYSIEIVKVDKNQKENKNFVIKITDENLIAQTGGIVQGMSGSPIIQNGKLIGAVTHVFLNDPTRGYGIDISTMLDK